MRKYKVCVLLVFFNLIFIFGSLPSFIHQQNIIIRADNTNLDNIVDPIDYLDELNTAVDYIANTPRNVSQLFSKISNTTTANSKFPKSVIDSKRNIHFVWEEWVDGDADILYNFYNFTSKTFSSTYNVSDLGYHAGNNSVTPDICIDYQDNLHVVWTDDGAGDENIQYRKYNAQTSQWENTIHQVTSATETEYDPSIACNSTGGIAIVNTWVYNLGIYERINVSFFDGSTWSHFNFIPQPLGGGSQYGADICCYNNIWYLAYVNKSSLFNINFHQSLSFGQWTGPETVRPFYTYAINNPEFSVKNNIMFLTWQESTASFLRIQSKNKTISGCWDPYINDLTGLTGSTDSFQIFSTSQHSDGDLFLAYQNSSGIAYKKFNGGILEYSGITYSPDNADDAPCVVVDDLGCAYFLWQHGPISEIYMRILDTYSPQLVVYGLTDDLAISGDVNLNAYVYTHDLVLLNYSYYDQYSWKEIHSWKKGDSLSLLNYTWNTNESSNRLDYINISISVKAVDEHGLDQEYIYYNINLDNHKPQISDLLNIRDDYGHDYLSGDTNFTFGGGPIGNIYFDFQAYDNNSLSQTVVRLYRTGDILVKTNSTPTAIILDDGDISDGNSYDFYIEVVDKFGNTNVSNVISNIRIDNTVPTLTIDNLNPDQEITNGYTINVSLTSSDRYYVLAYYYNRSTPASTTQLGAKYYPSSSWSFPFNIPQIIYSNITIVVNITDYADLTTMATIDLCVDNQAPTPQYLDPILDEIGVTPRFNITFNYDYTDNDVVLCNMYYREWGTTRPWELGESKPVNVTNLEGKDSHNATNYFLYFENMDLSGYPCPSQKVEFAVNATDNQGHKGSILIENKVNGITLIKDYPEPITNLIIDSVGYKISLSWTASPDAVSYLVIRSFYDLNTDFLNDLKPLSRMNLLGNEVGENFCIANITNTAFNDTVFGPNAYYYFIVVINKDDNPSQVVGISISIAGENPNTPVQANILDTWLIIYIIFASIFFMIIFNGNRRVKKKHYKARVEKQVEVVEEEVSASFHIEDIDLEDRAPLAREQSAILTTKVEAGKYASFEEKEQKEVDKCPTCGWILSSSASKCPRCGWQRV